MKTKFISLLFALLTGISTVLAQQVAPITIDGDFDDWGSIPAEYLAEASVSENAELKALYNIKFFAEQDYLYFYLEFSADEYEKGYVVDPFQIFLSLDANRYTGYNGYSWNYSIAADVLLEGLWSDNFESTGVYTYPDVQGDHDGWEWVDANIAGSTSFSDRVILANGHAAFEGKITLSMLPIQIKEVKVGVVTMNTDWMSNGCLPSNPSLLLEVKKWYNYSTSGKCGDNLTWNMTEGVLTISGTGTMYNYTTNWTERNPWNVDDVISVVIESGITSIGNYAFYECGNLTSIEIPNSVTNIGNYAFSGCNSIEEIVLGSNLKTIGAYSFDFPNIKSITCYSERPPSVYQSGSTYYSFPTDMPYSTIIYVPANYVNTYKVHDFWGLYDVRALEEGPIEPEKFTITWQDEDGNEIKTDELEEGETPEYVGETPTKAATAEYTYEFAGWLPKIKAATKDVCYTTFFERNKIETPAYTVIINGENCSLRISNEVPAGTTLQVEAVADECFEFQKWSDTETANPRTINVTEDANLTAEFNKLQYTITGKNDSEGGQVNVEEVNP